VEKVCENMADWLYSPSFSFGLLCSTFLPVFAKLATATYLLAVHFQR